MTDVIAPSPSMDTEGLRCFQENVKRSRCYLEFGSGGSTVYAATVANVPHVISVESDRAWSSKVRSSINLPSCKLYLEHCDIGEVGDWGIPKNREKIDNYWKYMVTPWQIAKLNSLVPDTILIDGRFRVACFLASLLSARNGTVILFDDYFDRPHYFVVEEFCKLVEKRGRMGVFVATNNYSVPAICEKIAQHSIQWA